MKTPRFLAALLLSAAINVSLFAQDETVYKRGSTYYENMMPPSPGPASVVKYVDIPFSHSAGLAEYDVPFYTLEGRELSIPIGLHYASGGIKLDEIAGVAGLGWMLEAGGCVTRTVRDLPDEFSTPFFKHELPSDDLLEDLTGEREECLSNNDAVNYLNRIRMNRVDSHLDLYNYNVCGLKGSFVIQDDGSVLQFCGDGVRIEYNSQDPEYANTHGPIDSFTLTGPDGTVYYLSAKETASHKGIIPMEVTPSTGQTDKWDAVTAWHITKMRSCSGLETATFTYSDPMEWEHKTKVSRTVVDIHTLMETITDVKREKKVDYIYDSYQTPVLTGISLNGTDVTFAYSTNTSSYSRKEDYTYQRNFPFRLTGIMVNSEGNSDELCRLDVITDAANNDNRIILKRLELYHSSELEDQWDFTYKTSDIIPSVGSQDWYGYYNGENETLIIGRPDWNDSYIDSGIGGGANIDPNSRTDDVCPFEYDYSEGKFILTNGNPVPTNADYMSLVKINHDGAVTGLTYEGNAIDSTNIGVRIKQIQELAGEDVIRSRNFTYECPVASGETAVSEKTYMTTRFIMSSTEYLPEYAFEHTVYDFPVTEGKSLQDTRVCYGRVTEDVTAAGDASVRTVYEFDVDDLGYEVWNTENRIPLLPALDYAKEYVIPDLSIDPWDGIRCYNNDIGSFGFPCLVRKEIYSFDNGEHVLVSSTDYEYNDSSSESVLIGYNARQLMHYENRPEYYTYDDIYHYPVYATSYMPRNPIKSVRVNYHPSGNDTTVVNTYYVSRTDMSEPVRVSRISTIEKGIVRSLLHYYSDTVSGTETWKSDLEAMHCLSVPLRKLSTYRIFGNGNNPIVGSVYFPYKDETIEYEWFDIKGRSYLLPISHEEKIVDRESWNETVLSRDCMGNISSFKEKGRPETVILWSYGGRYPVAVIENATMSLVANFLGGQNFIDGLTRAVSPSQTHLATLSAMRRILTDTRVTTYSYLPGIGVTSMTDPAGITTTYEYDHAGRLTCIRDNDGNKVEEYSYSLMTDDNGRKHMGSKVYRSEDGQVYSEDVRWWDKYGRRVEDISIDASGDGRDLVTAYGYDFMFHDDVRTWLPYPVETSGGQFQDEADTLSAAFHVNDAAYTLKKYEVSSRDRVTSTALPGYAGAHETIYETDVVADFPVLRWENGEVSQIGEYASDQVVVEKTVDADGRLKSVFKDNLGRILGTSNGDDEPTYHVYDRFDRLCAVVGSGIELSDTLNMWRYDYDSLGRLASKGIPSSVREYYEYDSEDRLVSVQRGNLLEEYEYDAFGRVTGVYRTVAGGVRTLCESHTYDTYPAGVTGSNPKGLVTRSRLGIICPNGTIGGNVRIEYSYDDRKRPVQIVRHYNDGSVLVEDMTYEFSGEVKSRVWRYMHGASEDILASDYAYDVRGRLLSEASTLSVDGEEIHTGVHVFSYDDMGRMYRSRSFTPGGPELESVASFTLQGWQESLAVSYDDRFLFMQELGYDGAGSVTGHVPQYSGLVTLKDETWFSEGATPVTSAKIYRYDYAGRLSFEGAQSGTSYTYDARGNMLTYGIVPSIIPRMSTLDYSGDRLTTLSRYRKDDVYFTYDSLGRMISDGLNDTQMEYNFLNLVRKVSRDSTVLVNYSYLADGTKLSASDGDGEGLVYRGPFVYRHSADGDGNSSLTFESASFGGGLLTSSGVLLYVKDYLGSVRAVLDADSGALYKAVGYSAYGDDSSVSAVPTVSLPSGLTLRAGYTGQEDQQADFGTGYVDFGARQYSPALRRWLIPDPQSEKSYGTSPYAFCNSNPVNYVDPDGEREWPVNSQYNGVNRRHENNYRTAARPKHNGVDINLGNGNDDLGAPVYATHDGIVTRYRSYRDGDAGGNRIQITSETGEVSTYYMHLHTMESHKVGDAVKEGDLIGTIGGTGKGEISAYAPHLHYEIRVDGEYVNPAVDSHSLLDPQQLIAPIHLGTIDPAIIVDEGELLKVKLPDTKLFIDIQ